MIDEKERKMLLALQALVLKIKALVDNFIRIHYPKPGESPKERQKI